MTRLGTLRLVGRAPARGLLALIWVYQRTLSRALPVLTMGGCTCRFSPTCSHYAAEAIRAHGAILGAWLALRRLLKCMPRHPGGFDPVPLSPWRPAWPGLGRTHPRTGRRTAPPICTRLTT